MQGGASRANNVSTLGSLDPSSQMFDSLMGLVPSISVMAF